jgi:hypothetical protein
VGYYFKSGSVIGCGWYGHYFNKALGFLKLAPAKMALSPSLSSILNNWLYLAVLSPLMEKLDNGLG